MNDTFMKEKAIFPLLTSMALPMVVSMLVNALYNIVDSLFVARISEEAMTALSLVYPVQNLINAIAIGFSIGIAALISLHLGAGNKEKADMAATHGMVLSLIHGVVISIVCTAIMPRFLRSFTSDETVIAMGVTYSRVAFMFAVVIMAAMSFEKIFQAVGRMNITMIGLMGGSVCNIILDPLLIFGIGPFPKMGIAGAALATGIGQMVPVIFYLIVYFVSPIPVRLRSGCLKPDAKMALQLYSIGVPAIIAQGAMSVMNYCVNLIFGSLDSSYVTAYGIVYKIQQFVLFAAFGLRDAITPIVSFSYGMQNAKRIREGVRCGLMYTSVLMLVCTAAVEILAQPLAGIFSLSAGTMGLCVTGLRVLAVSFVFAGANIAIQGVFQATEGGVQSLLVSLLRQLIFVLPAAWLFARLLPAGVWLAFPIAEVLTAVIAAVLLRHTAGKGRLSQQDHAASLSK